MALLLIALLDIAFFTVQETRSARAAAAQPSDSDWAKILASNGFGDQAKLITGLEILFAESGGQINGPDSSAGARGPWQFMANTLADDVCAHDPVCSTQAAFRTSKQGTDWSKWQAYTDGRYQDPKIVARAKAAISAAAPGCNWVTDAGCFAKMIWNAAPVGNLGMPSLDQAGPGGLGALFFNLPIDQLGDFWMKVVAYQLASIDGFVAHVFDGFWGSMIAGEDNLGGEMRWGGVLALDTTPVFKLYVWVAGIAGASLAVFLLTIGIAIRFLSGRAAAFKADIIYAVVGIGGIACAWWLMQQVLGLGNAFTNSVNSYVALELRALPVYQNLAIQHFSLANLAQDHIGMFVEVLASLIIVIELVILFFVYLVRAIRIWGLVVVLPLAIVAGFVPQGRHVIRWWITSFLSTMLIKPINALLFALFLLMGVQAQGFLNAAVLAALLFVMIKVPSELRDALGHEGMSIRQAHETAHALVTYKAAGSFFGLVGRKFRQGFA